MLPSIPAAKTESPWKRIDRQVQQGRSSCVMLHIYTGAGRGYEGAAPWQCQRDKALVQFSEWHPLVREERPRCCCWVLNATWWIDRVKGRESTLHNLSRAPWLHLSSRISHLKGRQTFPGIFIRDGGQDGEDSWNTTAADSIQWLQSTFIKKNGLVFVFFKKYPAWTWPAICVGHFCLLIDSPD